MPSTSHPAANSPTAFVNGLAWSFIGLVAVSLLLAAMLYVLFAYVLPTALLRANIAEAIRFKLLPASIFTALDYLPRVFVALCVANGLMLWASIGLLKRKPWARIAFAWMMIATAVLHIGGLLLPFYLMADVSTVINAMPPEARGAVTNLGKLLSVISMVMGVAFTFFFAWVAKRLFDADIRQEFLAPRAA